MDLDDAPQRRNDILTALVVEDLDPLSHGELEARITVLEGEIARCRRRIDHVVNQRASADALFRR